MIEKIISGGQTGVDRAALDVAIELGIACGGWCPVGRDADDGPIPEKYPLEETSNMDHTVRTGYNVRDSDGTLMLYRGELQGGTAYAVELAKHMKRPIMTVDLESPTPRDAIQKWIRDNELKVLHIGGQRESTRPGIYAQAYTLIKEYLGKK